MANELSPEDSERVKELHEAMLAEFNVNSEGGSTETAITDIKELKDDALTTLKRLIKFSSSEALQAKIAMWAYDTIVDAEQADKDALGELFKGMPKEKEQVDADSTS